MELKTNTNNMNYNDMYATLYWTIAHIFIYVDAVQNIVFSILEIYRYIVESHILQVLTCRNIFESLRLKNLVAYNNVCVENK